MPHYIAVMQYADNRELREQLYRAYSTRASELGKPEWDNTPNITRCLEIALAEANLLGYENYAELSLVTKMAETPAQVLDFLRDLAKRAKPFAQQDLAEVREFAAQHLGLPEIQSWDLSYASEKLRKQKYAFSETEVKKYFPVSKVLAGLFAQIKRLIWREFDGKICSCLA